MRSALSQSNQLFIALLAVVTATSWAAAQSRSNAPSDDEAIRQLVATFESGWNTHDMKAIGSIFRHDAEFINVVGMQWRGKDAIVKAHEAYHETMFKDCKLRTDDVSIRPLGKDYAIAVWVMTQDGFTTPSGSTVPKHQNRMTLVTARGNDGIWLIVQAQNTPIDAAAAQFDPVNKQ